MITAKSFIIRTSSLFGLSLLCALLSSFLNESYLFIFRQATMILLAYALFIVGFILSTRSLIRNIVVINHVALTLIVLFVTISSPHFVAFPGIPNANMLGAGLVVLMTSALLLKNSLWLNAFQPITIVTLFLIGSRMAIITSFIVLLLTFISRMKILVIILVALATLGIIVVWFSHFPAGKTNLLHYSGDLRQVSWFSRYAKEFKILKLVEKGAYDEKKIVFRIVGESDLQSENKRVFFGQSIGKSLPNKPYIASVYLRASRPQTVVLSTHLPGGIKKCKIVSRWTRCITPIGLGDGTSNAAFLLYSDLDGGGYDILIWKPQLEISEHVTQFEYTQNGIWSQLLYKISSKAKFIIAETKQGFGIRPILYKEAWRLFLNNPLAGVGIGKLGLKYQSIEALKIFEPAHAHNILLQLLAETGILGLVSWAITFFGIYNIDRKRVSKKSYILVLSVLLVNMVDYTYYTNLVYFSYWLTTGLVLSYKEL